MVISRRPRPATVEGRVDEANVWQRSRRTGVDERGAARQRSGVPVGEGVEERLVLERGPRLDARAGPEGQEGDVPVIVATSRDAGGIFNGRQLVPDGGEGRGRLGVVVPVGLCRVLVKAVRIGLAAKEQK